MTVWELLEQVKQDEDELSRQLVELGVPDDVLWSFRDLIQKWHKTFSAAHQAGSVLGRLISRKIG